MSTEPFSFLFCFLSVSFLFPFCFLSFSFLFSFLFYFCLLFCFNSAYFFFLFTLQFSFLILSVSFLNPVWFFFQSFLFHFYFLSVLFSHMDILIIFRRHIFVFAAKYSVNLIRYFLDTQSYNLLYNHHNPSRALPPKPPFP